MKHQATIFKKKYNEPMIKDLDEKESSKNKEFIGRRTGKNLGDHIANGNDFLLKNDFTEILENQQRDMYDLYSSDSDSSSSHDEESSESESEAEESERENSSNNMETLYTKNDSDTKIKKRINPTVMSFRDKNNLSNVVVNLKEKKIETNKNANNLEDKYKKLENRLMKDSPINDVSDVEDDKKEKTQSETESEEEAPIVNKNNKNLANKNTTNLTNLGKSNVNPPIQTTGRTLTKINAKNNFKSDKKELWTEKDENKFKVNKDKEDLELSFTSEAKVVNKNFIKIIRKTLI
jgi:hypothetical protein